MGLFGRKFRNDCRQHRFTLRVHRVFFVSQSGWSSPYVAGQGAFMLLSNTEEELFHEKARIN